MAGTAMNNVQPIIPPASADDSSFRRLGLAIILVVFGGFGAWATLAPLDSAALAPGVITVDNYRKTVQHLEGGIVSSIKVRDGESVAKGQALVTLDGTQQRGQLEILLGQYFIIVAREARLLSERDGLGRVVYPPELIQRQDDPRMQEAMLLQNQIFMVRKLSRDGEVSVYRRQIDQLRAKAVGLREQKRSHDLLVDSYQGELQDFEDLLKEGFAEKQKVRDLQRNLSQSEGQRGMLISDMAATELQVSETQVKILQLNKEFQREVAKDLGEVQVALFELRERIQALQDTVERIVVRAPEAGMVLGLAVHTVGSVIQPGARIMDIVPQHEKLIIEAQVSPADIDRVKIGQLAEIRFSGFQANKMPRMEGKLVSVSADRLTDETRQDQSPYYLARVDVMPEGLKELSRQNLKLVPGMPAEVMINTGSRTLFQYLTRPLSDSFARSFTED
jgi:epimerase transport system membrane fusion protein